jgi:hypothetical protein
MQKKFVSCDKEVHVHDSWRFDRPRSQVWQNDHIHAAGRPTGATTRPDRGNVVHASFFFPSIGYETRSESADNLCLHVDLEGSRIDYFISSPIFTKSLRCFKEMNVSATAQSSCQSMHYKKRFFKGIIFLVTTGSKNV